MIDWKNIKSVFLDMDGTLLDLNFDNHFWLEFVPVRYAKQHGITINDAKEILFPRFKSMEGQLEWYCLDYWSRELKLDIVGLKKEISGLITVLPHAVDFLQVLRKTNKRVVLVTNAHRGSLDLKMEKTCLDRFFDRIVSAHDIGLAKENPGFWEKVKKIEPFETNNTVMIDDSIAVLDSAQRFGIRHIVAMAKPDSKKSERKIANYASFQDFRQLLPVG